LKRVGFTAAQAKAAADSFAFGAIYDTTDNGSRNSERNKFIIKGVITPTTASTYSLGFNIVEGSVDVIVNGQSAPKSDYNVDYITGQVVIRNQALLVPGTNLQIRYEANDLFQLASKTLLGARGDLNLGKNASFGFTVMNLNQQSLSDKVRLGEEPISNTIMGVDGGVNFDVPFLTRALNVLPGIQTNASSNLSFRGEAAYMSPDPNTRKSAIPQDNSSGIAYIDDFEGARRLIPFSVNSQQWKDASVPFYMKGFDTYVPPDGISIPTNAPVLPETTKIYSKAKAFWFNVQPSDVSTLEIWPQRSIAPEQSATTVLDLHYRPITRGAFNYSMDLDNTVLTNPLKNWAGIQQLLASTSTNLLDENINFIEFWVKIEESQPTAKLNIDLGLISEDIIPNRELNTEDGLKSGIRNGTLNEGEDVGIDLLTDEQERAIFFDFINQAGGKYKSVLEFDPSGDNFVEPPIGGIGELGQYESSNGTEGNKRTNFPDGEDLNRNNNLDRLNAYFEYEIPLDTSSLNFRKYVAGGGQNRWYQIRIPINEFTRRIGEATLSTVEAVRIWVTGAQTDLHLRLTEMNLVGNQWEELVKNDSMFRVSVVNVEDNPAYTSPPGVERARDRSRPTQNIVGNEQALNLIIRDLNDGQSRQAIKRFTFKALDLFSYRAMKMFVRSSSNFSFRILKDQSGRDSLDYDAELFVRFGSDSLNFYEYRAPLRPAVAGSLIPEQVWDPQNDITINFPELTAVKLLRDSAGALTGRYPTKSGPPGSTFQVRGQPTLTNVRFIAVGVENPMGKGASKLNGEVWVNELRLTDVDNAPGWAYRFDTGLKLADIGSVAFSVVNRDPNFHGLEEHFGSRLTSKNWTLSANVALERFLPQSWNGTSLAFSYSHVESMQDPKYLPGTDILVSEAVERVAESEKQRGATNEDAGQAGDALKTRSQSLNVTETYAMPNIRLAVPVDTWLVSETINKMTFGYSYTVSTRRDPATESYEDWNWNARGGYALQFGFNNYLQPFATFSGLFPFSVWKDLKLYFTPRNINMNATLVRRQVREKPRNQAGARPVVRNLSSTRSMGFSWQFLEGGFLNPGVD
ncbi:MAG: gliding motility-related protein, partial [Bacteroidetes bacterium]|nr:gliding motility-related protein [Bacteroidota bacterium]